MLCLALLACAADRPADPPLEVPLQPPWHALELPAGRPVASGPAGLSVRSEGSEGSVEAVDRAWDAAIAALGFAVVEDRSRGDRRSRTYRRTADDGSSVAWALAVVEVDGAVAVDLRVLP